MMFLARLCFAALVALLLASCGKKSPTDHLQAAKAALEAKDTRTASIEAKNALQADPNSAEGRFVLGSALLREGNPAAAEVELRKALEAGQSKDSVLPALSEALLQLGQAKKLVDEFGDNRLSQPARQADFQVALSKAYWSLGKVDQSQSAQDAALAAQPDHSAALLLKARKQAAAKSFADALTTLEGLLKKEPQSAEAWKLKGDLIVAMNGESEQALAAYEAAVKADPSHAPAHAALVALHLGKGRIEQAAKGVESLKKHAPRALQTRLLEIQLAFAKRDFKQAREMAQQLVTVSPKNPQVLQAAGAVELGMNALEQAESYLEAAHRVNPSQAGLKRLLATVYLRRGKTERAAAMLNTLPDKEAPDPAVLALAGEVHLASGNAKQAEEYFRKALKLDPASVRMRTAVAISQVEAGQAEQGIAALTAIADSDTSNVADLALISAHLIRKDYPQALAAVDRLERKQPDKPTAANLRGRIHLMRKDDASARKAFEQALAIDSNFFAASASLAALDVSQGKPELARQRFESLLQKNPSNTSALRALAQLAVRMNAPSGEVAALLAKAIAANPEDISSHSALIELHLRAGDTKQAVAAAQAAVAAVPSSPELLAALGRAQYLAGDANQAATTFNRVASLMPLSELPHLQLAEMSLAAKDLQAALQSLKRALELKPDSLTVQRQLVLVSLMTKDFAGAVQVAQNVQKQQPTKSIGFLMEGDVLAAQQKWDATVAVLRKGLKQTNSPELAAKLHATLKAQVSRSEADQLSASWLAANRRDTVFLEYLGDAALAEKNLNEAAARYKAVLAIRPDHAVAMNNLAWVSVQLKSPDAVKLAERANELAPNQSAFLDTLAWALAEQRDFDRATKVMRRAIELQPANPNLQLGLAKLLLQAGNRPLAKAELEKLEKLGDKFTGQSEVKSLLAGL